jgi:hypothetical protein
MLRSLPTLLLLVQCVLASPLPAPRAIQTRQDGYTDVNFFALRNACNAVQGDVVRQCPAREGAVSTFFESCITATSSASGQISGQQDVCAGPCFSIQDRCTNACAERFGENLGELEEPTKQANRQQCYTDCRDATYRCRSPCRIAFGPANQAIGAAGLQCCQSLGDPSICSINGNATTNPPVVGIVWPKDANDTSGVPLIVYGNEFNLTLPRIKVPNAPVDPLAPPPIPPFSEWPGGDYGKYCAFYDICVKLPQNSRPRTTAIPAASPTSVVPTSASASRVSSTTPTSSGSPNAYQPQAGNFTFNDCMCDQNPSFLNVPVEESFSTLFGM